MKMNHTFAKIHLSSLPSQVRRSLSQLTWVERHCTGRQPIAVHILMNSNLHWIKPTQVQGEPKSN